PTGSVPNPACQATELAGGNGSGCFFATTVPRPNSQAAAKPIAAPGSFSQVAPAESAPTISATPPRPSRIATTRRQLGLSPSIGQASTDAHIGSVYVMTTASEALSQTSASVVSTMNTP